MPVTPEPDMAETNCRATVISAAFSTKALNGLTEAANSWADAARVQTDPIHPVWGMRGLRSPCWITREGSETESGSTRAYDGKFTRGHV